MQIKKEVSQIMDDSFIHVNFCENINESNHICKIFENQKINEQICKISNKTFRKIQVLSILFALQIDTLYGIWQNYYLLINQSC